MSDDRNVDFQNATPVLKSGDYARSRAYYEGKLGYAVVEEGGDPPRFGIFRRGRSVIFVNAWQGPPTLLPDSWEAYVHVSGLDALYAAWYSA